MSPRRERASPPTPVGDQLEVVSAITQPSDAIAEEGQSDAGRGELQVPYVPAALRFYLPQWVAFDDQDRLLVGSVGRGRGACGLDAALPGSPARRRGLGALHGGGSRTTRRNAMACWANW